MSFSVNILHCVGVCMCVCVRARARACVREYQSTQMAVLVLWTRRVYDTAERYVRPEFLVARRLPSVYFQ